ncbi:hypothetical protein BDY19DRAFT_896973 [Irpex rosettiformis]|uniref:Uncharacterized protein n=1 Tax=Irpex rosettiformis TaxID=378272 RepID=A0ACB8TTS6_9APHY|nr:hypothetical protein BDY19DRAFT_896973 [Irpex rosettiformis]
MTETSNLKALYDSQGYVLVSPLLSTTSFAELQIAAGRTAYRTRNGQWQHRRTVGSQFPPYDESNPDSWGVQHVMHPDLHEPAFAKWYTSDLVVNTVATLLGCEEDELQMELFNMLINPTSHNFALRWHRDDVREDAIEEEEREALDKWHYGTQWNTALYRDSCLYVVPGSHKVPRTPEQRVHSSTPDPPANPLDMPGAIRVDLKGKHLPSYTGETIFYNSNILHCATYDSTQPRATLHACMGSVKGGSTRARNILQHGLDWMVEDRFKETLDDRGKAMLERLIRMKESAGEVGYSLSN